MNIHHIFLMLLFSAGIWNPVHDRTVDLSHSAFHFSPEGSHDKEPPKYTAPNGPLSMGDQSLLQDQINIQRIEGRLYGFYQAFSEKDKQNMVVIAELDADSQKVISPPRVLWQIASRKPYKMEVAISVDQGKILAYTPSSHRKKDRKSFLCAIFNASFSAIGTHDIVLPHKNRLFTDTDLQISESGKIFISGRLSEPFSQLHDRRLRGYKGPAFFSHKLYSFDADGQRLQDYPLGDDAQRNVLGFQYKLGRADSVICGGWYGDNPFKAQSAFSYVFKEDQTDNAWHTQQAFARAIEVEEQMQYKQWGPNMKLFYPIEKLSVEANGCVAISGVVRYHYSMMNHEACTFYITRRNLAEPIQVRLDPGERIIANSTERPTFTPKAEK
ncbi:MAG: hypothetical protein AAF206_24265 [Bacteroidota bacterium]